MDLSLHALQTSGKLFSNFEINFRVNYNFSKIIVPLGINAYEEGEAFVLISTDRSSC